MVTLGGGGGGTSRSVDMIVRTTKDRNYAEIRERKPATSGLCTRRTRSGDEVGEF